MNNLVLERAEQNRCPICNKEFIKGETPSLVVVEYAEVEVFVHKEHIYYKEKK